MSERRENQPEDKHVEQRQTSGDDVPPSPALRRQGDRPGAGADTPAGPFPRRTTEPAKRERRKQARPDLRDGRRHRLQRRSNRGGNA